MAGRAYRKAFQFVETLADFPVDVLYCSTRISKDTNRLLASASSLEFQLKFLIEIVH